MKPVYTDIVSPVGEALIVLFFLIEFERSAAVAGALLV